MDQQDEEKLLLTYLASLSKPTPTGPWFKLSSGAIWNRGKNYWLEFTPQSKLDYKSDTAPESERPKLFRPIALKQLIVDVNYDWTGR